MPVQNMKIGDKMIGYDTSTGQYIISTVLNMKTVTAHTLLVIHTASGLPLRTDASVTEILWTKHANGTMLWLPVTELQPGDSLFTQNGWDLVTSISSITSSGNYTMYDMTASMPYFANGYLDPPHPS
jgi:hypothetical protein